MKVCIAGPAIATVLFGLVGCSYLTSPHLVCKRQVLEYLDDFGIHPGDISHIPFDVMSLRHPLRYRLQTCPTGHVAIDMSDQCMVEYSYTVGGCMVEGIPAQEIIQDQ